MSSDTAARRDDRVRPWLAAGLALLMPGAGHLYLRAWVRALLWFGLFYTTFLFVVPEQVQQVELSLESIMAAATAIPLEAQVAMLAITALSMADSYWLARRLNDQPRVSDNTSCPNCGKDLDGDIDFCHWCTTPIEGPAGEEDKPA